MLPIPLRLLIHEATLNEVVIDDLFAEQDKLLAQMYHVRFEPSTRVVVDSNGADVQCTATMFFDSVSSWPVDCVISVGNTIIWEGRRYRVRDVQRLYDDNRLHHLEVELSDG